MPSTTRGSILISTANDIGEALVEKLGGVGYSPNEWKEKYNLCGIAPIDSAPALSVLADSAGTGDERGSILIATADAIGAILNKKYNVLRGFKPKEWASACRKMKALEEGSVASSSIASFSDGADDVQTKSLVVTIPPTLSGVSAVTETQTGVNIWNEQWEVGGLNTSTGADSAQTDRIRSVGFIRVQPSTQYYFYNGTDIASQSNINIVVCCYDQNKQYTGSYYYRNKTQPTLSNPADSYYIRFYCVAGYGATYNNDISINYPATDTAYHAYNGTTYTANLGRTIYGGTADIVNGTAEPTNYLDTANAETKTHNSVSIACDGNGKYTATGTATGGSANITFTLKTPCTIKSGMYLHLMNGSANGSVSITLQKQDNTSILYFALSPANRIADLSSYAGQTIYSIRFYIANGASFEMSLTPMICYSSAVTPYSPYFAPFTFTGQEIPTRLGYNAFWNDCGNTAVEYYQAPTPYARKTATGGIANFSDQRTDLPLTKAIANIAPSIAGKSAVNLVRAGKNLYNIDGAEYNGEFYDASGNVVQYADCAVSWIKVNPGTKYSFSCTKETSQSVNVRVAWCKSDKSFISRQGLFSDNQFPMTLTTPSNCEWLQLSVNQYGASSIAQNNWSIQVEQSETSTTFAPYNGETYTAELGETVYGGSVDFVSGAKSISFARVDMGSLTWQYDSANTRLFTVDLTSVIKRGSSGWITDLAVDPTYTVASGTANDKTISEYATTGYIYIKDTDYTDPIAFKASLSGKYLTYPLATPTESAIPGRVISPIEGVNNYWNDAGGDTEIQYFEDEA